MRIEIAVHELQKLVKLAGMGAASRSTKPTLMGVKLDAHDDMLTASGTDLDVGVSRTIACQVRRAGAGRLCVFRGDVWGWSSWI